MTQFADYKIPILDWSTNAGSYKNIPVDMQDSRAAEPLVKVQEYGIEAEIRPDTGDNQEREGATRYVWCREGVAERMARVNRRLAPFGVELFVEDGYRPVRRQEGLWKLYWNQSLQKIPQATDDERREYVLRFVSDPAKFSRSDSRTWPIHTSGAAVDVTLCDIATKQWLDMGASTDEISPLAHTDMLERKLAAKEIGEDDAALRNRRLLHSAMTQEGFINYPYEFWHFDYGDQMYVLHARLLGLPDPPTAAWYGYAESPVEF